MALHDIDPDQVRRLAAHAQARGLSVHALLKQWLDQADRSELEHNSVGGQVDGVVSTFADIAQYKQTQAALPRGAGSGEERLRSLFHDLPTGLVVYGPHAEILMINPAACRMFGRTEADLLGKSSAELLLNIDDQESSLRSFSSAFAQRLPFRIEYRLRRHDGQYRWIQDEGTPRYLPDGTFAGYIAAATDITDLKQAQLFLTQLNTELEQQDKERAAELVESSTRLQASENRHRAIMDANPAAVFVVDQIGYITYANWYTAAIFEESIPDLVGKSLLHFRFLDPFERPVPLEKSVLWRVMESKQAVYDVEQIFQITGDQRKWLILNAAPILDQDNEVDTVVFTMSDITLQKVVETTMQAGLDEQQKLSDMKSHFLSLVSHEFRTPLTIMKTTAWLLRSQEGKLSPAQREARLDQLEIQVERLADLIDTVTTAYRLQTSDMPLDIASVDPERLIQQAIDDLQLSHSPSPRISLNAGGTCGSFYSNEQLLYYVIVNLLSNAIKYSPLDAPVGVTLHCEENGLQITIRDEGIGIPLEDQRNLFQAFYRAKNVGTLPGTGLGLSIVKRCVDALGGTIRFESSVGSGTTFVVTIPSRVVSVSDIVR